MWVPKGELSFPIVGEMLAGERGTIMNLSFDGNWVQLVVADFLARQGWVGERAIAIIAVSK